MRVKQYSFIYVYTRTYKGELEHLDCIWWNKITTISYFNLYMERN